MQPTRIARLTGALRQEIARIIHQELKDPRLGFVTITRLDLSNDLRHAKVFFGCLGGEAAQASSQEALDHSAGFVRGLLKKRFRLKVIPELQFRYDPSVEGSIALSEKLDRLRPPPAEPGPPGDR